MKKVEFDPQREFATGPPLLHFPDFRAELPGDLSVMIP
jgi:hypothetical protein